tara:strand:+ start:1515 stop:1988 length:474 start_codon:yes stop_codon:yes gene_type:complete
MIELIYTYFSVEMIYLWLNLGVLPFWFMLLFFPQTKICKIFITSIFPILIFAIVDLYLIFEIYKNGFSFLDTFYLYLGMDELLNIFSDKSFVILFWIHFLAINLFCGCWMVRDYQKINMPKFLAFFPLIITYFVGPFGLSIYWLFRIFFSKRIDLYE